VAGEERALAPLSSPLPTPIRDARREGTPGQLVLPHELALADFARHLSLSARNRTAGAYLDTLQRLVAFELDPLQADRGDLERFLSRGRRGRWGDWEGALSTSTQTAELAARRRFYRWARSEALRPDDPSEGIRPPRREPYARARGLSAEEVARLLAVIPADSAAGLRLRALVLAYLLTGRRRSEVLNLRWRDLDLEGGFYRYTGKGGKERQRALPPPVREAILAYAQSAGLRQRPEEAVFPGRWQDGGWQVHWRAAAPGGRAGRDPTRAAAAHAAAQLRSGPASGGGAAGGGAGSPRPLQPGHHIRLPAPAGGPGGSLVAQAGPRAGAGRWGEAASSAGDQ
jgi:site-specific recombinase XerD